MKDWISPKAKLGSSGIGGRGIFAKSVINEGEKIVIWKGNYTNSEGAHEAEKLGKLIMRWDDDLYSVEDRGEDQGYFINHSCDPNLWLNDAHTLVARREIQPGEELTADYALWEADEDYVSKWGCGCGSSFCRKKVTGKDWRLNELQERYRGHFSPLINKRILKQTSIIS
ncbi:MAG: SET domain-containing protein-lysine N-methyltransferase [Microgenomates group bacterium]